MNNYHRYTFVFIIAASVNLLLIVLFNIFVDPYGVMNSPTRVGFNKIKPGKDTHVRLFKTIEVTRLRTKMIVLGSSRSEFGLDPKHPALLNYQPAYNLAITGANMYETRRYFQHAIANQPSLKKVVLGIDFFMFNTYRESQPDFRENRLQTTKLTLLDTFDVTLSLNALTASIETIRANRSAPNDIGSFYPNGLRDAKYYIQHTYQNKPYKLIFKKTIQDFLTRPDFYKRYQLSEASLNDLKTIVNTCKQRGIKLEILISPSHASEWETIRVAGLWPIFEDWKRQVVKIEPVWDFSGYNSITTEPISNHMKNYIDNSHYRKEVGNLVLNRIFHYQEETVPTDFGVLLTPANIEACLKKIRDQRGLWAKDNTDVVQLVEDLKLTTSVK